MQARPTHFLADENQERGALARWLREYAGRRDNRGALVHWHTLPAREARHGELLPALPAPLVAALEARGITRLYTHQVRAVEALRAGHDTVVVTGTASGKSLCFHLPALRSCSRSPARPRSTWVPPRRSRKTR